MKNKKNIYLNSRDELYRIEISKIVYFEADGNYTNIVLSNNIKAVVCMNLLHMQDFLKEMLSAQDNSMFCRIGKRYIVNLSYIFQINILRQKLVLSDGDRFVFQLDISKDALKKLKGLFVMKK
ncbi:MAG: LytTR family transcriptional regulator [Bacteroidales bacterium]|nr:LytTR family transcriptional regulator [Bacteroidales bacterium]